MKPRFRPLPEGVITTANTALLVIDMQNDFVAPEAPCVAPGALGIVPVINRMAEWARGHGMPVIITHEMHRADKSDFGIELEFDPPHCLEGTSGFRLTPGLNVQETDSKIFLKRRYDCFLGTDLDLLLRARGVKNLICCGVLTHVCVLSTVYTARNLDYRAIVPIDCVASTNDAISEAALACMSDVCAYLSSSEAILGWSLNRGAFQTTSTACAPVALTSEEAA